LLNGSLDAGTLGFNGDTEIASSSIDTATRIIFAGETVQGRSMRPKQEIVLNIS
jgi:hypothetical protein